MSNVGLDPLNQKALCDLPRPGLRQPKSPTSGRKQKLETVESFEGCRTASLEVLGG